MSEEIKFKCEECGKEFDPEPEAMVEIEMGAVCECCDCADNAVEEGEGFTPEQIEAMNEVQLAEIGLTPETRTKLLEGETIVVGAACICKECQDKGEEA